MCHSRWCRGPILPSTSSERSALPAVVIATNHQTQKGSTQSSITCDTRQQQPQQRTELLRAVMLFTNVLISRPNASKARLPALYADFRPLKQNNPEGYVANIQVWQSALSAAISQSTFNNDSILVLDITSQFLSDISLSPYGRPLGITSVVVRPNCMGQAR